MVFIYVLLILVGLFLCGFLGYKLGKRPKKLNPIEKEEENRRIKLETSMQEVMNYNIEKALSRPKVGA